MMLNPWARQGADLLVRGKRMISPDDLDLSSLPWMPLSARTGLIDEPGIYFAVDSDGVVQYIGRSKGVRGRWKSHHRFCELDSMQGIRICFLALPREQLQMVEKQCILYFNPALNQTKVKEHHLLDSYFLELLDCPEDGIKDLLSWTNFVNSGKEPSPVEWAQMSSIVPEKVSVAVAMGISKEEFSPPSAWPLSGLLYSEKCVGSCGEAMVWISRLLLLVPDAPVKSALPKALKLVDYAQAKHWKRARA
jgi:hypothetical protein